MKSRATAADEKKRSEHEDGNKFQQAEMLARLFKKKNSRVMLKLRGLETKRTYEEALL